jgi:proteasome lid subunit RPN8/RPN11
MVLRLTAEVAEQIRAHGAAGYPYEICGALLGGDANDAREVAATFPLDNRRKDSPRNRFSLSAGDVRAAERAAGAQTLEVVGWYHSHPDHPARPIEFDSENAWPWYSYIIVSVAAGVAQEMTSWRLADDRSGYHAETVEIAARARN